MAKQVRTTAKANPKCRLLLRVCTSSAPNKAKYRAQHTAHRAADGRSSALAHLGAKKVPTGPTVWPPNAHTAETIPPPMAAPVLPPIEAQFPALASRFWKSCISHIPFHIPSAFPLLANTVYHAL